MRPSEPLAVDVAGYRLAAQRWTSEGSSTIVLLHAGVCDQRSWYSTAEHLTGLGTVIAYDRRGFGDSPVSSAPYRDIDDLWAVVEAVTTAPVWLVGSSMGGLVSLDAALARPDRVAGLVLFGPAVSGAPELDDDPQTDALAAEWDVAATAGDRDRLNQLSARIWLDGPSGGPDRVTGPARALALAMNEIVLRNDVDEKASLGGTDAWSELERLRMPVTIACGDLDLPSLVNGCEQLAARIAQSRHLVLPGTAHLPYLEQPEAVADVIREALRPR
jgi:pimeloyl-ACP methyl ester carboxylesterase